MSCIKCPNYAICERLLYVVNEPVTEGNRENKINIRGKAIKSKLIKLESEIPVCWECGASYSTVENEHQNKYLSFIKSMECCICFNTTSGVSFPNCKHYTCVPCHKRCFFGPDPINLEFPIPSMKQLYLSDPGNIIWEQVPEIKEFKQKEYQLEIDRMEQWYRETNLRTCPLCRS